MNRCNDAVSILRTNPSKFYEREEVDPLDTSKAITHQKQVVDGWNRAKAKLAQVPDGELDPKDADLAECFAAVTSTEAYLELLDRKIKVAAEQGKVFVPFLATVKPQERSFIDFLQIAYNPAQGPDNYTPAALQRALADLGQVEQACAGIPADFRVPPKDHDPKTPMAVLVKRPFAWCRIASRRVELTTHYLANKPFHAEGYGAYAIVIPETIKKLESGKGFMEAWIADLLLDPAKFKASLRKEAQTWYQAGGIAMPADPFTGVDKLIAALQSRVDEVAPTIVFEAGPRAPALEAGAQKSLLKLYPKAKVVKAAMDASDFEVRTTGAGIPTDRFRSGQIMFRLPTSKHCLQRQFSYNETYIGGGKFQKPSAVNILGATRFMSCK